MRQTPLLLLLLACLLVGGYLLRGIGDGGQVGGDPEAIRGADPLSAAPGDPRRERAAPADVPRERTRPDKAAPADVSRRSDVTSDLSEQSSSPTSAQRHPSLAGSGEAPAAGESAPTPVFTPMKPAAGRTVHVRVLKEGLEQPLPNALVVLVDAAMYRHEARTDKAGDAYLHGVASKRGTVDAVADGWIARWTLVLDLAANGNTPTPTTVIRMQPAVAVRGTVRSAEGRRPVAGARVIAVAGGRVHGSQGWSSSSRGEYATVMTNASGCFRFRALPVGQVCTLVVLAPGFQYTTHGVIPAADLHARESVEILLEAGGRLVGRVTSSEGDPVGGAVVYVYPEGNSQLARNPRMGRLGKRVPSLRGTTAADGSFEVIGLPFRERFAVTAEAEGPQYAVIPGGIVVTALEPTATLQLRLEGAGSLCVDVVDADGGAVSAARVSCTRGVRFMRRGRTDAEGVARFSDVPEGQCRIRVARAGFVPAERVAWIGAGATTEVEVSLQPRAPGVEVEGVVVGSDGQPLSDVHVSGQKQKRGLGRTVKTTTDRAGRFVLVGLPAGPVGISATKKGYTRGDAEVVAPAGDLRIQIGRWAKIRGRVELPPGLGKPPFLTVVREMLEQTLGGGTSSVPFQEGTFEFALTPATRTRVQVCGDTFIPWTTEVWVGCGETKDLGTIRVESGIALAGAVVGEEGSPVQGVVVSVKLNFHVRRTATTDAMGRFRLEHLPAGAHVLRLLAPGHDEQEHALDAQTGGDDLRIVLRAPK